MSCVKIFALSLVMVGSVLGTTRGDSIHSTAHHERQHHRAEGHHPVRFDHIVVGRIAAAENLARSQPGDHSASVAPTAIANWSASVAPTATSVQAPSSGGLSSLINASPPSTAPAPTSADAFINFGSGPYPLANSLTTGNGQAFFNSPVFTHLFANNAPTSADVATFENQVLATIQKTYNGAGLAIHLTDDPTVAAAHTLSVVSGTSFSANPNAIGITQVGSNGFSFIDKFAGVQTESDLANAIGHNLSHELMHAFGIANHPEQAGPFIDAATTSLATLTDSNTGFSPAAASLLSTLNFRGVGQSVTAGAQKIDGDQVLVDAAASAVPEPSTVVLWLVSGGLIVGRSLRRRGGSGQLGRDQTP